MEQTVRAAIELHRILLEEFESAGVKKVIEIADMIVSSLKEEGCVFLCGNGGSAADAQHIAGEFVGRFRRDRRALPAVALSTDTSVMTCIGNDYSFEDIFIRQVDALMSPRDILWAFSTSGTSKNILTAARRAKEKGAKVIAFTGRPGSELETISDITLCINSSTTSSVQEIHQLAYHIICELVEVNFFELKG
jgi:D-sedoheptulose 7-phosphate isomerase